jgi:hypothetical protein
MVSPKEKTVGCPDCHTRENGRLAGLTDFYMPGRDTNATVDTLGTGILSLACLGIAAHVSARVIVGRRKKERTS